MLPGIEAWLEPVEGLEGAGKLWVRGPNIMKGYITSANPGIVKPLVDGWYDTGDIVSINEDGHYVIRGRLKRFAKIGGEMVSLTVVENCASAVWPEFLHAAAILPDLRKGEQIVLVTDNPNAKRSELLRWAQAHGVPELSVPKKIISTQSIPILGTGKLDYKAITQLAQDSVIV
jgi:acyl-[acyl-carrier-protein]-phospholipid O-acyltransferase/long-chain-fatty-acid--[acyl-carrier-protein] ligase